MRALERHAGRFAASLEEVDPDDIGATVRRIRRAREEHAVEAVTTFPAGCSPQVPLSDRRYYAVYQTCVDVMHFDEVCFGFPELRIVMRHGAEPWEELAVKLMIEWSGLSYMTSGFAPRYCPNPIVEYANTRGADRVMDAGYYPMGLSLRRIVTELPSVALRDHVWPSFLRDDAVRVFNLNVAQ